MATEPQDGLLSRRHQMFPTLAAAGVLRARRFGTVRNDRGGERLYAAGEASPGMFVVLSGHVTISQRDGLGHVTPITAHGGGKSAKHQTLATSSRPTSSR